MIHDAKVEVTCDGKKCDENIFVDLNFVYPNLSGRGGHYDHDTEQIEKKIKREGWTVRDGKHFCEGCSEQRVAQEREG